MASQKCDEEAVSMTGFELTARSSGERGENGDGEEQHCEKKKTINVLRYIPTKIDEYRVIIP